MQLVYGKSRKNFNFKERKFKEVKKKKLWGGGRVEYFKSCAYGWSTLLKRLEKKFSLPIGYKNSRP